MTKVDLKREMGKPSAVSNSVRNRRGQMEDVWQYTVAPRAERGRDVTKSVLSRGFSVFRDPSERNEVTYHFIGDRLARWGPKGATPPTPTQPATVRQAQVPD